MRVAGITSTGSKRADALFGPGPAPLLGRVVEARGARYRDERGRDVLDFVMALGAVALGYAHPAVVAAARAAVERGTVGSVAPVEEERLADLLGETMPWLERVRFLKTGAEAVAAAVRIARVATGRDRVLGAGYHGWLDWGSREAGVPTAVEALYEVLPFNDAERGRDLILEHAAALAAVVVEPVIDGPPDPEWLSMLREETERAGAVLVFDEIKTGFRVSIGGAVQRWGVRPDLVVLGKAVANGFPLAVVGGRADLMDLVARTWISSTLATESVALAAAIATVETARAERVPDHLARTGARWHAGLTALASRFPHVVSGVSGLPEMCYLTFRDAALGGRVAADCYQRGLLFKRSAYNFVSLAHGEREVDEALGALDEALTAC